MFLDGSAGPTEPCGVGTVPGVGVREMGSRQCSTVSSLVFTKHFCQLVSLLCGPVMLWGGWAVCVSEIQKPRAKEVTNRGHQLSCSDPGSVPNCDSSKSGRSKEPSWSLPL